MEIIFLEHLKDLAQYPVLIAFIYIGDSNLS